MKKSHISLKNSPRAAESWKRTYLEVWGFLPVNLHFATKLFTEVPNFLGHWMRVPAPYKQTKNQTNATTEITAGSCYREVRWNWKVSTNGQNPTFSHLSARSQLRKWQWPSSSRCVAGHTQEHHEKEPNFSKEHTQGCWKRTYLEVWGFLPVNLHFATKLFTAVPNFLGHWMRVSTAYKQIKNETNATTEITAGSCYREVRWNWKVSTDGQNPTFSHLSARSQLRKWHWPSSSRCVAGHRK